MKVRPGQVALITGASRGLGVYMAKTFAARDVNLVLAARSTEALESLCAELETTGIRAVVVQTDMSRAADVTALYTKAKQAFGQIDYVINNAGIELVNNYLNLSPEDVQWVMDVNLTGPMLLSQLALADMYERDAGHIVNIASAAGYFPPPYSETYSATKAGLIAFTLSLRSSIRLDNKHVGASVMAPGYMDDAGMYVNMVEVAEPVPWFVGSLPAQDLADAVIRVIERDAPLKLLMPYVPTFLKLVQIAAPRVFEAVALRLGIYKPLVGMAKHRASNQAGPGEAATRTG